MYQRAGVVADDLQSLWGEALEPHRSSDFTSRYLHRSSVSYIHVGMPHTQLHLIHYLHWIGHSSVPFSCGFLKGGTYAVTCDGSIHIWVYTTTYG